MLKNSLGLRQRQVVSSVYMVMKHWVALKVGIFWVAEQLLTSQKEVKLISQELMLCTVMHRTECIQ
jgi:hypothetical protein